MPTATESEVLEALREAKQPGAPLIALSAMSGLCVGHQHSAATSPCAVAHTFAKDANVWGTRRYTSGVVVAHPRRRAEPGSGWRR
jgi:hypothetical protein